MPKLPLVPPATVSADSPCGVRLDSWKQIAAHLNRDVSTVQRWERREGMPVHRHVHDRRGSVYAFTSELDAWLLSRKPCREETEEGGPPEDVASSPAALASGRTRSWPPALVVTGLLASTLVTSSYLLRHRGPFGIVAPGITSLAVLPLQDLSEERGQEYFADGMTDALITRLSAIRGVRVISRTSVMRFKESPQSIPEIAEILRVDAVVEGAVVRSANRVRVTAQLIRSDTDESMWSATYEREVQDVLSLQSEVAQSIADRIAVTITGAERGRLRASHVIAPRVYETYVKGRFQLNKGSRAAAEESVRYFEAAIAEDPSFAPAHAGLASAYNELSSVMVGTRPQDVRPKAIAAATRAVELDPELAEGYALLGWALTRELRWADAEAAFRRAIDLNPSEARAHAWFAGWLVCHGRFEEAVGSARRARDLDPLSLRLGANLGWILYQARRYDEAIGALRSILAMDPDHAGALWLLGFALVETSRFDEAIHTLERSAFVSDRSAGPLGVLVRAYTGAGRRQDALRVVDELTERRSRGYVPASSFVNAYMGLDDYEQAFAWLERGYQERTEIMQFLKVHPVFDPIRSDPRFADLLRRVGPH